MSIWEKAHGRYRPVLSVAVRLCILTFGVVMAACGGKKDADPGGAKPPAPDAGTTQPVVGGIPGQAAALDGAQLLKDRCTKCHNLERVDAAEFDRAKWEKTVSRMLSKPGGDVLNEAEKKAVVDYLASRE